MNVVVAFYGPAPVAERRADKLTHKQKEEQQQGRRRPGPA